jgi:hypothetical protein
MRNELRLLAGVWLYCILRLYFLLLNSRKLVHSPVHTGNCSQMIRELRSQELCLVFIFIRSSESWRSSSKMFVHSYRAHV